MGRTTRIALTLAGVVILVAAGIVLSSALFFGGEGLRQRVEETLTRAVGREVHIGKLDLSLWSGRLVAEEMTVAEAPAFGAEPFVRAARVDMGVEVWPLILRRQVRINSFVLRSPAIRLLRHADGAWNYAGLGRPRDSATPATGSSRKLPDLAISRIEMEDGSVLVSVTGPQQTRARLYNHLDLSLRQFSLAKAFPVRLSADLPGGGRLALDGSAGPWNQSVPPETPFSGHVQVRNLDLAESGLSGPSTPVRGDLDQVSLSLTWKDGTLSVSDLKVDSPALTVTQTAAATDQTDQKRASVWNNVLDHLVIRAADVTIGKLTVVGPGERPESYRQIVAHVDRWSRGAAAPFTATAVLPGDGDLAARATLLAQAAGARAQEFDAHVTVRHLNLGASGYLPVGSPVRGSANLDAEVNSRAGGLRVAGTARIDRLALAANGIASAQPVQASFALTRDAAKPGQPTTGTLEHATVSIGAATAQVAGTFRTGSGAAVHLNVQADAMPIDQIEAFLPALGIELPEGSRLSGGTLTTALRVDGASPHLFVSGPVHVTGTRLNGFDLGSKLTSLAKFTGGRMGSATGSGTTIRSLSLDLNSANGTVETSKIIASIVGIGTATGGGSIGPGGTLKYALSLKLTELVPGQDGGAGLARQLAGQLQGSWAQRALGAIDYLANGPMKNGIPILIGGTAKHPTFTPNLGALIPAERPRR